MIYENSFTIQGRVCGQPQTMRSQNGNSEWEVFYVGIPAKDGKQTVYLIEAWDDKTTKDAASLVKGEAVKVTGYVSSRTYTDRSGNTRVNTSLRAGYIRKDDEHKQTQQTAQQYGMNAGPSQEITSDMLPF